MRTASLLILLLLVAPLCGQDTLSKKLAEYQAKYAALDATDIEGRRALAKWCAAQKLRVHEKGLWRELLKLAPEDKGAHEALGHVSDGAKWHESHDAMQLAHGKSRRLTEWAVLSEEQKRGLKACHDHWLTADEVAKLENGEALVAHASKSAIDVLTREYYITSALAQAKTLELASLIEQAMRQWRQDAKKPYEAAGAKSLRIHILKDNAAFVAMIKDDIETFDQQLVKAQGFYDGQVCWLSYFDNWFQTIHVLLHEARHQFDCEIGGNVAHMPNWYFEGNAEYYGTHSWDGKTLKMGVLAPDKNYSLFFCNKLIGQKKLKGAKETLEDAWSGKIEASFYQNSWGFLYFLRHSSYADGFRQWEQDLLTGKLQTLEAQLAAFKTQVGDIEKFDKDYRAQIREWSKQCPKEWK